MNFAEIMNLNSINENMTHTENGALVRKSLNDDILDLFSVLGAMRIRSEEEIQNKFEKAFHANANLAIRMLFYTGDIRGGLGERRTFRICLKWLANNSPEVVLANLHLIPFYNRWDSLFVLLDTPCQEAVADFIAWQLINDMDNYLLGNGEKVSLLAKWMPSENASSQKTRKLARKLMTLIGFTAREYRKVLTTLRKHLRVVEADMSANNWEKIDYEAVPSIAMNKYHEAFYKHDKEGFVKFVNDVKDGKAKINANVIAPHQLSYIDNYFCLSQYDEVKELQWKNMPNYVHGENNYIVMADVSGSMRGNPIKASTGLATYFAQRNKGHYHNLYMTFSSQPHYVSLDNCHSLHDCLRVVLSTDVGYSTDLEKAFLYILNDAIKNKISNAEMPKALIVISDMEIDSYFIGYKNLNFIETMEKLYQNQGYDLPKIILWNVESRHDIVLSNNPNTLFVSGYSTTVFKNICGALEGKTAWDLMLDVLMNPRYDKISIPSTLF